MAYIYIELFIIILTIFRCNVGFDWHSYFGYIYPKLDVENITRFEPIPKYIYVLADYFHAPIIVFVIHGIVILYCMFYGIKNESNNRYESLIVFIGLFYLDTLGIMRQWMAVSILFYAYKYVKKRNLLIYLLYGILAYCCHKSAIIGILGIYILYNFVNTNVLIYASLFCLLLSKKIVYILSISNLPYVSFYFRTILGHSYGNEKVKFVLLLLWVICFIILKIHKSNRENKELGIVCFGIIWLYILGGHIGARIGIYFYVYFIYLVPNVLCYIKDIRKHAIFMVFFYAYFLMMVFINLNSNTPTYNYKFYFLETMQYELNKNNK